MGFVFDVLVSRIFVSEKQLVIPGSDSPHYIYPCLLHGLNSAEKPCKQPFLLLVTQDILCPDGKKVTVIIDVYWGYGESGKGL